VRRGVHLDDCLSFKLDALPYRNKMLQLRDCILALCAALPAEWRG